MLLNDIQIRNMCISPLWYENDGKPMIEPFSEAVSGGRIISYGLTSAGYDLRLANEILMFKNSFGEVIDPKMFGSAEYKTRIFDRIEIPEDEFAVAGSACIGHMGFPLTIPAHGYVLARSYEYLRIPRRIKGRCVGKSTYARAGILINCTPLEPGWEGHLVIEIGNVSPCPAYIYVMEGIAQLEFELLSAEPETDYSQKSGKYQGQTGVTPAIVK